MIHLDLLIKDNVFEQQRFNNKYKQFLWPDEHDTDNDTERKNIDMTQSNVKRSITDEQDSSQQYVVKESHRKRFLPVAPMIGCLVISSVLTWINLNDFKILIGCATVLLLCMGYFIYESSYDIYDLCFILATCCGFLVMLSFLYGISVEGIEVNAGIIVSTIFSLLSAGYFISRPRAID